LNLKISATLAICLAVTFPKPIQGQDQPITKRIRIDPSSAMGGTASQYIDKIQFITFQTTPKSAFGNIDQLEITDKYFIILDRETKAILIFNKQGQFHAKIEAAKISPQDPSFYDFYLDKQKNLIEVDYPSDIYVCDLDGKLVSHTTRSLEKYSGVKTSLGSDFSGYYFYSPYRPYPTNSSIFYEIMVHENDSLTNKYLPYSPNSKYSDTQGSQSHTDFYPDQANDSTTYFVREYDYNIYKLTPHTFTAAYQFIFPLQVSLPKNFRTDSSFNAKRQKFIGDNKSLIYKLGNFYKTDNYILFKTIAGDFLRPSYLFSTKSQTLIVIDKIVSDATSYFLPITDAEAGGYTFINHGILLFDGESFYTSYSSLLLLSQMEATKNKKPQYPPVLAKYLGNNANSKGNPVLVQIKFKSTL
jgi:hypothetical protein